MRQRKREDIKWKKRRRWRRRRHDACGDDIGGKEMDIHVFMRKRREIRS